MRYLTFITLTFITIQNFSLFAQNSGFYNPLSKSILLSLSGGSNYSFTDYGKSDLGMVVGASLEYYLPTENNQTFGFQLNASQQYLSGKENNLGLPDIYDTGLMKIGLGAIYSYAINSKIIPFGRIGASDLLSDFDTENVNSRLLNISNGNENTSILLESEIGLKIKINKVFDINIGLGYNYTLNDNIDAISYGDYKDFYLTGILGVSFTIWEQKDSDGDGVLDEDDKCPMEKEDLDGFEDDDGCPDPDNDNDGILDFKDLCQNIPEDIDGFQDDDGCPDPDNDGDGIDDKDDSCPDVAEDFDGYEDEDGCPDADNDGDGILDSNDKCVDEAEVFNGYQDDDGCPDELPEPVYKEPEPVKKDPKPIRKTPVKSKVSDKLAPSSLTIHSETTFETNSAQIKSIARSELNRIISELKKYPNTKWRIEGHTDSKSSRTEANQLTKSQADAILNYFIAQGLNPQKFQAIGFGDSSPIASNASVYGKMKNRRIIIRKID